MGWALCQAWSEVGQSPGFLTEVMRMDRGGCRESLAAPAKMPSLSLSLFFWLFFSLLFTHQNPQWLLSTMTKTGPIMSVQQRTDWCRRKTWLIRLNFKKIIIRAGTYSSSLDRQLFREQRKDVADKRCGRWGCHFSHLLKLTTTSATTQTGPHMGRGLIQSGFLLFQRWSAVS